MVYQRTKATNDKATEDFILAGVHYGSNERKTLAFPSHLTVIDKALISMYGPRWYEGLKLEEE